MADHVLPATHAGTATQASAVAFHVKAGVLQAQLDWPVSELLALYSCVELHRRHAVSPRSEKLPAPQGAHTMSDVGLQVETPSWTEPAGQAETFVQFAQGARPVAALKLTPETHESRVHVAFVAFHAKLVAHPQLLWPVRLVGA